MTFTGQYHIDYFGPVRPYVGGGLAYAIVFRNISTGVIGGPRLDNNVGPVVQAGVDYAITDSIGLYIDFKKALDYAEPDGSHSDAGRGGLCPCLRPHQIRPDPSHRRRQLSILIQAAKTRELDERGRRDPLD